MSMKSHCKFKGGGSLKESLMYELEFLVGFGDSNLKPSLREVWISPRAPLL